MTIEEESVFDWTNVREQIVRLLDDNNLSEVAVKIGRGRIWYGLSDRNLLPNDSWQIEAKVGRSIEPCGRTEESGNLGGFVKLTFPDDSTRVFGLTCFHCVVPDDLDHPKLQQWQQRDVFPNDPMNDLSVKHPSLGDREESLCYRLSLLEQLNSSKHVAMGQRIYDPDDFVAPYLKKALSAKETTIKNDDGIVKAAEAFFFEGHLTLGSIFAASGKRRVFFPSGKDAKCDWALIDVRSPRMSLNYVSFISLCSLTLPTDKVV